MRTPVKKLSPPDVCLLKKNNYTPCQYSRALDSLIHRATPSQKVTEKLPEYIAKHSATKIIFEK